MNLRSSSDSIGGRKQQSGSRSIYRGYSHTGIGENPTSRTDHGEQYLDSDPELWIGSLPNDLRAWMTLDDRDKDQWALGEKMEGWSYLSIGGLLLVVRLASAGPYRGRSVYFSHCRAWHAEECSGGFDPGALIGWRSAFDQPWRDSRPSRGPGYPGDQSAADIRHRSETVWAEAVKNERAAAVQLLAHFLEACKTHRPLVIAVPIEEFVEDNPLYHLIAFARAALPETIKINCRIRIYTSQPEAAISAWKCDLIVIPEDLAPDALAARRDAMLLDRRGRRLSSGPPIDTTYAEAVVERMVQFPGSLFSFSARIARMPQPVPSAAIPLVYNLAEVFPSENPDPAPVAASSDLQRDRDSLLVFLYANAGTPSGVSFSDRLIEASEWRMFSDSAINELAFSCVETPSAEAFRSHARTILALEKRVDQDKLMTWWASVPEDRRLSELRELIRAQLVSSQDEQAALMMDLPPAQVKELMGDPSNYAVLLRIQGNPNWAEGIGCSVATLPQLVKLARQSSFWRELAFRAVEHYISSERNVTGRRRVPHRLDCPVIPF